MSERHYVAKKDGSRNRVKDMVNKIDCNKWFNLKKWKIFNFKLLCLIKIVIHWY